MAKSSHDYYYGIPYNELKNFIEPVGANVNISMNEMRRLVKDPERLNRLVNNIYDEIIKHLPSLGDVFSASEYAKLNKIKTITYTAHTSGYDFRINPIDLVNNIMKHYGLEYRLPFFNMDSEYAKNCLKDYLLAIAKDLERKGEDLSFAAMVVDQMLDSFDFICGLYDIDLDKYLRNNIKPKDMLFYLAYKHLDLFEKTNDWTYLAYPYEYYYHVSKMDTSQWPCHIILDGRKDSLWYTDFREEYNKVVGAKYMPTADYLLTDHDVLVAWDIMQPGMVERELKDIAELSRAASNVDYDKYQKLFEAKLAYYLTSPYVKYIKGKYGLSGYVGFSYPNEYIIFDKFHNSDTLDQNKKTILTHGEAIFAVPSDRFSVVRGTKQDVIEAKKTDERIKKINHTNNLSFLKRLDDVIKGPNVSTALFEDVLEQEKRRMLIHKP
jgi:hypothetical protein